MRHLRRKKCEVKLNSKKQNLPMFHARIVAEIVTNFLVSKIVRIADLNTILEIFLTEFLSKKFIILNANDTRNLRTI